MFSSRRRSRTLKWGANFCNNVREIKYYFNIRGIRKKERKKGAQKKAGRGGGVFKIHPFPPPLDPRLSSISRRRRESSPALFQSFRLGVGHNSNPLAQPLMCQWQFPVITAPIYALFCDSSQIGRSRFKPLEFCFISSCACAKDLRRGSTWKPYFGLVLCS